ncbi:hypothetical protein N9089_01615 [Crocinitomicaceae bacterium]|nr:hypothetical protein [Crocinitomicaceae bacterium]
MVDHGRRLRRRWTQFSLRSLLILTLVVASFLAGRLSLQRELERARVAERDAVGKYHDVRIRLRDTMGKLAESTERVRALYGSLDGAYTKKERLEEELARQEATSH